MALLDVARVAPRETALDRLAKGVGIARDVVGIGSTVYDAVGKTNEHATKVDPESPLSVAARKAYSEAMGGPVAETASAAQLQELYGPLSKFAEQQFELKKISAKGAEDRKTAMVGNKAMATPKGFEYVVNPETGQKELTAKASGEQFKAALFGKRMEQANGVFDTLDQKGFDPTSLGTGAQTTTIFGLGLPERFKSGDVKSWEQAKRNFVNAVLRRESGAAIAPSEFESAEKQYFPAAGDPPELLAQKAENRRLAIEAMKAESGNAWSRVPDGSALAKTPKQSAGGGLIPEAYADNKTSFSADDLQAFDAARARLQANPNDEVAKRAISILRGKGLK